MMVEQEQQKQQNENKMGIMPVNKLLITMSLPMMISMLVQALYNIVDSIFVSMVSEDALTAVSLAFPIQILMIAIGTGTGVGINAILSKSLGENDKEKVSKVAENGIFLAVLGYVLFLLIGLFVTGPFYRSQTDVTSVLSYGQQYLTICCACSFGIFMQLTFEKLLQATGKTMYTMATQGTGAIINLILDPILIFGYFGFPKLGVAGAALATVIGQTIAGILAIYMNQKVNSEVKISYRGFKPDKNIIGQIYKVGVPSIFMQAIGSVMTYGMNQILLSFTITATTVFGVYFKVQSFIFMPIFGLNNGMIPIVAYNYGAGKRGRVIKAIKLSMLYSMSIMFVGFLVFQIFPKRLLMMFNASNAMLEIGIPAFRIISIGFLIAGFCIIAGTAFQALGNAMYSLIVSVARQLVVLLPAAYLLSLSGVLSNVWWSFPIAEIMALTLTVIFLVRVYHKVIREIPDNA
ncbi:MAG TPA: MATE family efflux transporter [Lachnospiraceae bacterium]|nr:MATE family efflux transporter [Lachnospiraceae bacterium]